MKQYLATFSSTYAEADQQAMYITSHLKKFYESRLTNEIEFNLNFVMREMFNNAVEHGNHLHSEKIVACKVLSMTRML
jgi:anti-sigma regulatory factor (Ser/Thr protein kinase)